MFLERDPRRPVCSTAVELSPYVQTFNKGLLSRPWRPDHQDCRHVVALPVQLGGVKEEVFPKSNPYLPRNYQVIFARARQKI